MEKLLEQLRKLSKFDLKEIVFNLLLEEKLSYVELSELYTESLNEKLKQNNVLINGMAWPLIAYWEGNEKEISRKHWKAKSAWNLLKSGVFRNTEIEKDLKKCIKKYGYEEDENGWPNKVID